MKHIKGGIDYGAEYMVLWAAINRIAMTLRKTQFLPVMSDSDTITLILNEIERLQEGHAYLRQEAEAQRKAANDWYGRYSALHASVTEALKESTK